MKNQLQKGFTQLHFLRSNGSGVWAQRKSGAGFTLIELLIVIALLGALAVGLIGTIDPFEQLKKGTDTSTRNTVSEVHSSIIRYYALKGRMPWCETGTCSTFPEARSLASMLISGAESPEGALSMIIGTGELKSNFPLIQEKELDKIYVTGDAANATVCYHPVSKSFNTDDNSQYDISGGVKAGCPGAVSLLCNWCVQ